MHGVQEIEKGHGITGRRGQFYKDKNFKLLQYLLKWWLRKVFLFCLAQSETFIDRILK